MIDTAFESVTEQSELLQTFARLGIDIGAEYADVIAAGARMDRLTGYASTFDKDSAKSLDALANQLATDPGDYEMTIAQVLGAALSSSDGVREKVFSVFNRAENKAAGDYLRSFRKKEPTTLRLLSEKYQELVVDVARDNAIDIGIQNLQTAARAGVTEKWLALEQAEDAHRLITRILVDLTKKKVLTAGIIWRMPDKLADIPGAARGAGGVYLAAAVAAGADPAVVSGEEWKQANRERGAQDEVDRRRRLREAEAAGVAARAEAEKEFGRKEVSRRG